MNKPMSAYSLDEIRQAAIHMAEQRKYQEAYDITSVALRRPDADRILKMLFAHSASKITMFGNINNVYEKAVLKTLEEEGIDYQKLSRLWGSLIFTFYKNSTDPILQNADIPSDDAWKILQDLVTHPIFYEGLRRILIEHEEFEIFMTRLRRFTLLNFFPEEKLKTKHLPYICAMAEQCFTNEYAWFVEEDEKEAIAKLPNNDPFAIAILGCYEPLHRHNIIEKLSPITAYKKLIQQQVTDHYEEQKLKGTFQRIGNIEDQVSQSVQSMYEENPYPCWRYIDLPIMPLKDLRGKILIAGCGTGKMLTQLACLFPDLDITAIDISSSSLAYAKRVSSEYGAKNIEFIQCDILNLDQIPGEFDFINCSGVLHHMKDPIAGWKKLIEKLSPGAMMLIGLYSTKAREVIADAHEFIKEKNYKINPDDIRSFRKDILNIKGANPLSRMRTFRDFYSTSDVRDLVFHVQETTYDIPELRRIFEALELNFEGFKIPNDRLYNLYKDHYPDDVDMMSLDNWHELEIKHPYIFGEMYNFKCTRKNAGALNAASRGILASGIFNF